MAELDSAPFEYSEAKHLKILNKLKGAGLNSTMQFMFTFVP